MAQLILTATQQATLSVSIRDKRGNAASVTDSTWEVSEPETLLLEVDPTDPRKAVVKAAGPTDEATLVTFTADADLGEGVVPIIGTLDVVVTAGQAVVVEVQAGTPTEQPDAPTP